MLDDLSQPPVTRTLPVTSNAAAWRTRETVIGPVAVNRPVAGS